MMGLLSYFDAMSSIFSAFASTKPYATAVYLKMQRLHIQYHRVPTVPVYIHEKIHQLEFKIHIKIMLNYSKLNHGFHQTGLLLISFTKMYVSLSNRKPSL